MKIGVHRCMLQKHNREKIFIYDLCNLIFDQNGNVLRWNYTKTVAQNKVCQETKYFWNNLSS